MRTFYVFKINQEMRILMKETPYNLYRSLEGIYLLDKASVGYGKDLLDDLIVPIDKEKYNRLIYDKNKDNDFYMKIGDNHKIVNKYRKEDTSISVRNSHILLKTNIINKDIRKFLPLSSFFACDFENKDYFWLEELIRL
jgi:hypothetical protein